MIDDPTLSISISRNKFICKIVIDGTQTSIEHHSSMRLALRGENNWILELQCGLWVTLQWFEIHNERVFHGEDRIIFQVLVLSIEDLSSAWLVSLPLHLVT
jgi:hypothetical protein